MRSLRPFSLSRSNLAITLEMKADGVLKVISLRDAFYIKWKYCIFHLALRLLHLFVGIYCGKINKRGLIKFNKIS